MRSVKDPANDILEKKWWSIYSEMESLTWSNDNIFFRKARAAYYEVLASALRGFDCVIDMGCGNGVITKEVSNRVDAKVFGFDYSQEQISFARRYEEEGKTSFTVGGVSEVIDFLEKSRSKVAIICSGFLHHLDSDELSELIGAIKKSVSDQSKLIVCEPVVFPGNSGSQHASEISKIIAQLIEMVDLLGEQLGYSHSDYIRSLKSLEEKRWWGTLPFGPSPKELPFTIGELRGLMGDGYKHEGKLVQYLGGANVYAGKCSLWAYDHPEFFSNTDVCRGLELVISMEGYLLETPLEQLPDSAWYLMVSEYEKVS